MKTWIWTVMVAGLIGAGPATRPTTKPKLIDEHPLIAALAAAEANAANAAANATATWKTSAEYMGLKADFEAKKEALANARLGNDARAKLDASAAYNAARIKFEKADASTPETSELRDAKQAAELAKANLNRAREENRRKQEAADAFDPIKRGIKDGRPVLGMTLEEVRTALKSDSELHSEDRFQKVYRFRETVYPIPDIRKSRVVWGTFVNGKLVAVDNGAWEASDFRPTVRPVIPR